VLKKNPFSSEEAVMEETLFLPFFSTAVVGNTDVFCIWKVFLAISNVGSVLSRFRFLSGRLKFLEGLEL
jgi:hypothetical protein